MLSSIGNPTAIKQQPRQHVGFKAGFAFKKTDPLLPKLTALKSALVKKEYKGYQYFCFFPYRTDIQGKQKALQKHAENQMRQLGAKPVKVDTPGGEYLSFAVEKKIDELVKTVKKIMPTKKTSKPLNRKRYTPNVARVFYKWLTA